jgi:hypothetical protein
MPEDFLDRPPFLGDHEPGAFVQSRSENGMLQIRSGFLDRRDGISPCHVAVPKSLDLRKDEPHPMRLFAPLAELTHDLRIDAALRIHKTLEIVAIRQIAEL